MLETLQNCCKKWHFLTQGLSNLIFYLMMIEEMQLKEWKNALKILFNDDDNDAPTTQSLTNWEKVKTELLCYSHEETLDLRVTL